MRKFYIYIIFASVLCAALTLVSSCTSEISEEGHGKEKNGMMQMNLFLFTADYSQSTRANGSVKGVEGIEDGSMQILCFDKGGYFLGMGKDVTIAACTDGDGHTHTLKATVYNSTARIHLLANANINMPPQWVGMGENTLMTKLVSKYDTHEHMVYWGYKKAVDADEMKKFLNNGNSVIYMLRDRARVTLDYGKNESEIKDMQLALAGGLDRGSMVPFDRKTLLFPEINSAKEWYTSLDFVTLPSDAEQLGLGDFAKEAFTYETNNSSDNPLVVILKATYSSGKIRYHKVYLQDSKYENYKIKRNHTYRINVQRLSAADGYDTAQEAVAGRVSNDIWGTVADIVSEIKSGDYTLTIRDGKAGQTSIVYTNGADIASQNIPFTYSGDPGMAESDFGYELISDNVTSGSSLSISYSAGHGNLSFELATIGETLNKARIRLQDKKHGLSRVVNLYSISHFSFWPYKESLSIGKKRGDEIDKTDKTEGFFFTIPDDYPQDLFPVTVKFASNDLNPVNLDVEVSSTKDVSDIVDCNCWFTMKCEKPGRYPVTMRNVRDMASGAEGHIYMKADYFGKEAASVGKAIDIPVTFK